LKLEKKESGAGVGIHRPGWGRRRPWRRNEEKTPTGTAGAERNGAIYCHPTKIREEGDFFLAAGCRGLRIAALGLAFEKVAVEIGGELAGHDEKLVANDFGKGTGPRAGMRCEPHWNMRPAFQREAAARRANAAACADGGAEELSSAIEEDGEAENEKGSERKRKKRLP